MKIAIVHEMLVKIGGAEKVVEKLLNMFPEADLFTLIYDENKVSKLFPKEKINKQVFDTKTQFIYKIFKNQRFCLPFMASSVESFDLSEYDIVISSSSGFAHGVITKPETKHIIYSHSPARYLWDWTNEYKKDIGFNKGIKGFFINKLFLRLRKWDFLASNRADIIIANSKNTQNRIKKYHRKESSIIYPPVEISRFGKKIEKKLDLKNKYGGYYIILSALTEFKKIDLAIKAFNQMPELKLVVIGEGNYKNILEGLANKNINFVGTKYGEELVEYVQSSSGLIFPGEEDFGIVPIEVMAAGKPIFALNKGGLRETVIAGETGEFFENEKGEDFIKKFKEFDKNNKLLKYKSQNCKSRAKDFDEAIFEDKIKKLIKNDKD